MSSEDNAVVRPDVGLDNRSVVRPDVKQDESLIGRQEINSSILPDVFSEINLDVISAEGSSSREETEVIGPATWSDERSVLRPEDCSEINIDQIPDESSSVGDIISVVKDMDSVVRPDPYSDARSDYISAVRSDISSNRSSAVSLVMRSDVYQDKGLDESLALRSDMNFKGSSDLSADVTSVTIPDVNKDESLVVRQDENLNILPDEHSEIDLVDNPEEISSSREDTSDMGPDKMSGKKSVLGPEDCSAVNLDQTPDEGPSVRDASSVMKDEGTVVIQDPYPNGRSDNRSAVIVSISSNRSLAMRSVLKSEVHQDEGPGEGSALLSAINSDERSGVRSDTSSDEESDVRSDISIEETSDVKSDTSYDMGSDVESVMRSDEISDARSDKTFDTCPGKSPIKGLDAGSSNMGSDVLPQFAFCFSHTDNELDTFCASHERLICYKCATTIHRKCRQHTIKEKLYANQEQLLLSDIDVYSVLQRRANHLLESWESDKDDLTASVKRCRADVEVLRERINFRIDQIGQTLDSCLKSLESRLNSDIDKHVTSCKYLIEDIETELNKLETCQRFDDTTTYIGQSTVQARMKEMEKLVRDLETEFEKKYLEFKPSANIDTLFDELNELGEIVISGTNGHQNERLEDVGTPMRGTAKVEPETTLTTKWGETREKLTHSEGTSKDKIIGHGCVPFRRGMRVEKSTFVHVRRGHISGSSFLPDGSLVLCDGTNLLHYTDMFKYKAGILLPTFGHDVAAISNREVVVTLPGRSHLQFMTTDRGLVLDRIVKLDRKCYGIDYSDDKLYISCRDGGGSGGRGEVLILNISDNVLSRIGQISTEDRYMFQYPDYICVNRDGSRIYVSDMAAGTITCLSESGQIIGRSQIEGVIHPVGMCLDHEGQLAVCEYTSGNMFLLADGRDRGMLCDSITEGTGDRFSRCLTYRPDEGIFLVGMDEGIKVFWLR